ncbi:YibE/F family protein [Sporosarcina saromensis]|uniref:YibE/F family protein n=1 Tax=Sporosarcina saromensis TaxID=359365 RepID=A0ABU4GBC4_9BACL|nr:YibE/F family protein [Sporosarcina saromensis]MDW0113590.1 YibE/F family protein [Sporosarcina saromensis]
MFKKFTRKQLVYYTILAFCFITSVLFVNHNYSLYNRSIAEITAISIEEETPMTDRHGNEDLLVVQQIEAIVKNGIEKGQHVQLTNEYSYSGAFDQAYRVGHEVFIQLETTTRDVPTLTGTITDLKRDKHVVLIAWIFIFALLLIGRRSGFFAICSFVINVLILSFALDVYIKHSSINLLLICGVCILLFTCISLVFVSGFTDKTYAAIVATLLSTFLSLAITYVVISVTSGNGLRYEEMQFLTRPYELVFMGGLFIGSLGAIMDIAITMSSSIFALYDKNPTISLKALRSSGMAIGREIMGTITNILFFAYISGALPMLILSFKNATPLGFTFSMNLSLEIARALAGGIGIVLTIPIGVYTTLFFITRKKDRL